MGAILKPDFCRKMSIKHPSSPVITKLGGFVILSDFHSLFSKIKAFKKYFLDSCYFRCSDVISFLNQLLPALFRQGF